MTRSKPKYERKYTEPNITKGSDESNWSYCLRNADAMDPAVLIRSLLIYIDENRKRGDSQPLWSKVGEATGNGSGFSSAIVAKYLPECKE